MTSPKEPEMFSPISARGNNDDEFTIFMRHFVATILPYGVVFGSILLKVPQIVKVLQNRSADGISFISLCFEMTSYVITTSWGIAQALSFKDFGENMCIMLEMALLFILVGYLQKNMKLTLLVFIIESAALAGMSVGMIPRNIHEWLLSVQILFGLSSRVPQIIMNYRNQSTGHLSVLTFYLAMVGGISRLLTTFHNVPVEKGKHVMLTQFAISVALNLIIILQILTLKEKTENKLRKEKQRILKDEKKMQ